MITAGHGREAAFAAAILGDNALMEKAWQDTGMLAEAVLHAHVNYLFFYPTQFIVCICPLQVGHAVVICIFLGFKYQLIMIYNAFIVLDFEVPAIYRIISVLYH